jgi:hypothetical protein
MDKYRKKIKPCIGDIFSIQIDENHWAFARIINLNDGWDLAEVSATTSEQGMSIPLNFESEMLYPPFHFPLRHLEAGALSIIGRVELAPEINDYLKTLKFKTGMPGRRKIIRVNEFIPERSATEEEVIDLPVQAFYSLGGMILDVKKIIASGYLTKNWLIAQAKLNS